MSFLLIQFLLVLVIFPGALLGIAFATWRRRSFRRLQVNLWWVTTLSLWGVWATRLLTLYLGRDFDVVVRYYWRVGSNYPLSFASLGVLITTLFYLGRSQRRPKIIYYTLSAVLILVAFLLDPALWPYDIPAFAFVDVEVTHFGIWAVVWSLSVLVPLLLAWLIAEQSLRTVPQSLYRNQVAYWFTAVTIAFVGTVLALLQSSFLPQQIGTILLGVAGLIGMLAVTQGQLANLRIIIGQIGWQIGRISLLTAVLLAGLVALFALLGIQGVELATLFAASVIFAIVLFIGAFLLSSLANYWWDDSDANLDYVRQQFQIGGSLLPLAELTQLFRQVIHGRLQTEDCWLLNVQEAPGGGVLLTSLHDGGEDFEPVVLQGENPFVQYLYMQTSPLMQQDIDDLYTFNEMVADERRAIAAWQKQIHIPIRSNTRLVALLSLGPKYTNEAYDRHDFAFLEDFAAQMGNLLVQSRQIHALRRISADVFERNLSLAQERRRLKELVALYEQFSALLSPELRRPFTQLEVELRQLESQIEQASSATLSTKVGGLGGSDSVSSSSLGTMRGQVDESQAMVDNLIAIASHLEKQSQFEFGLVYVDGAIRAAMYQLRPMAEARRVRVELDVRGKILPVWGDESRLQEAVQQLIHNAIKFNRINGQVQIICQMVRTEIQVQVVDYGVGIPSERMQDLWQGLTKLFGTDGKAGRRRTRIGLPLVKFIVQSHGGRVASRSTYGSGSTFTIHLPTVLEEIEEL